MIYDIPNTRDALIHFIEHIWKIAPEKGTVIQAEDADRKVADQKKRESDAQYDGDVFDAWGKRQARLSARTYDDHDIPTHTLYPVLDSIELKLVSKWEYLSPSVKEGWRGNKLVKRGLDMGFIQVQRDPISKNPVLLGAWVWSDLLDYRRTSGENNKEEILHPLPNGGHEVRVYYPYFFRLPEIEQFNLLK